MLVSHHFPTLSLVDQSGGGTRKLPIMSLQRTLLVTSVSLGFWIFQCRAASDQTPCAIDSSIVLRIGAHEISHYLVDKYFGRYIASQTQDAAKPVSVDTKQYWFENFLAQQTLVAEAEELGYSRQSDVQDIVKRMEHTILTQRDGPFYQLLYERNPVTYEYVLQCYKKAGIARDLVIAHFEDEKTSSKILGADFADQSSDEKLRRIIRCRTYGADSIYEGTLSWPFYPFLELADAIGDLPSGQWLQRNDPLFGT